MLLLGAIGLNGCIGAMVLGINFTYNTEYKNQNSIDLNEDSENSTFENEDLSNDKTALLNSNNNFSGKCCTYNSDPLYKSQCHLDISPALSCIDYSSDEDISYEKETTYTRYMRLFSNKTFLAFLALHATFGCTHAITVAYFPVLVVEKGLTVSEAVIFQSLAGVANSISRIGIGYITNVSPFLEYRSYLISFFEVLVSLSLLISTYYSDFNSLALISIVGGISAGASLSQLPTTISDIAPFVFLEGLATVGVVESIGSLFALFLTGNTLTHTSKIIIISSQIFSIIIVVIILVYPLIESYEITSVVAPAGWLGWFKPPRRGKLATLSGKTGRGIMRKLFFFR